MERNIKTITLPENKKISFETGKIAKQANGSVLVRLGDTILFATACSAPHAEEEADFLPLRVDYQEKFFLLERHLEALLKEKAAQRKEKF